MKFKPTIGTDLTGKLGGIVASHNTYGAYFRRLAKPVNPKTIGQRAQRSAFGAITQAWRGLSTAVQALWIAAAPSLPKVAKNGSKNTLTGQGLFMSVNTLPSRCGAPLITTPPSSATAAGLTTPAITVNATGAVSITYGADEWNVDGGCVIASISAPVTNGRNYVGEYHTLLPSLFPDTAPVVAPAAFTIPAGSKVQLQFTAETPDGRRSQKVIATAVSTNTDLTAAHAAAAGSATLTFAAPIRVTAGQTLAQEIVDGTTLHALADQTGTVITVAEVIGAGDGISVPTAYTGVNATTVPIVST